MLAPESDELELDPDFTSGLDGIWMSDWDLTKAHLTTECRLDDDAIKGYGRLMGKMTAQYCGNRLVLTMPEIRYAKDDEICVVEGWKTDYTLNVIGRTHWQIAFLSKAEAAVPLDKDSISLISFVDFDIYWVYLGNSALGGQHVREYFRRVDGTV